MAHPAASASVFYNCGELFLVKEISENPFSRGLVSRRRILNIRKIPKLPLLTTNPNLRPPFFTPSAPHHALKSAFVIPLHIPVSRVLLPCCNPQVVRQIIQPVSVSVV